MKMYTACTNVRTRITHPIDRKLLSATRTKEGVKIKLDRSEHGENKYYILEFTQEEIQEIITRVDIKRLGESLL